MQLEQVTLARHASNLRVVLMRDVVAVSFHQEVVVVGRDNGSKRQPFQRGVAVFDGAFRLRPIRRIVSKSPANVFPPRVPQLLLNRPRRVEELLLLNHLLDLSRALGTVCEGFLL